METKGKERRPAEREGKEKISEGRKEKERNPVKGKEASEKHFRKEGNEGKTFDRKGEDTEEEVRRRPGLSVRRWVYRLFLNHPTLSNSPLKSRPRLLSENERLSSEGSACF